MQQAPRVDPVPVPQSQMGIQVEVRVFDPARGPETERGLSYSLTQAGERVCARLYPVP